MTSFLTGTGVAVVLAAAMLWVMEAGTITMVERSDDMSTIIENIWNEDAGPFEQPEAAHRE